MRGEDNAVGDDLSARRASEKKRGEMNNEKTSSGQNIGINISGGTISVGGDMVGRDKFVGTQISQAHLEQIFHPIQQAVNAAPPEDRPAALQKLEELKSEAAKGKSANDSVMAKLVAGLVALIPSAVSSIVSAFGTPLLGGIAGPVTRQILQTIQGK
jgi:hypothetical protein